MMHRNTALKRKKTFRQCKPQPKHNKILNNKKILNKQSECNT